MKLGDADVINQHIAHKYKLIKAQLLDNQKKLQEVCQIIKMKNPSLAFQIQESSKKDGEKEEEDEEEKSSEEESEPEEQEVLCKKIKI